MNTVQGPRGLEIGDIAPNFALPDEFGKKLVLDGDDVAGHFAVLIFTGAAPPEQVRPQLQSFAAAAPELDAQTVQVLAIATTTMPVPGVMWLWPRLTDADGQCHAAYLGGAGAGVTTVVLAPNRHVIAVLNGTDAHAGRALAAVRAAAAQRRSALVSAPHPPVLMIPDVLSRADCQHLIAIFKSRGEIIERTAHGSAMPAHDYKVRVPEYGRRDRIDHFIVDRDTNELIHSRYRARLFPEIKKAFQYDVTRYEPYRIGCYEGERGGELHGHRDNTLPIVAHRRFAVSVNLNAEEFEGGELRFPEFGDEVYRPETGTAIAFSCSMLHEAMHVTTGRRYVLLAFLGGEH